MQHLLLCFKIDLLYDEDWQIDIEKDFNTLLSFSDKVPPLKISNTLRVILGSKPEKIKTIDVQQNLRHS